MSIDDFVELPFLTYQIVNIMTCLNVILIGVNQNQNQNLQRDWFEQNFD
uniref:Uncharacterized protein n=1 Tax=Strigamia maritima TaxID=126957 RepID=T1J834_STRMM